MSGEMDIGAEAAREEVKKGLSERESSLFEARTNAKQRVWAHVPELAHKEREEVNAKHAEYEQAFQSTCEAHNRDVANAREALSSQTGKLQQSASEVEQKASKARSSLADAEHSINHQLQQLRNEYATRIDPSYTEATADGS